VMDVMAEVAVPPNALMQRMSACTPEPPVPSEPVIVNMVCGPFMHYKR